MYACKCACECEFGGGDMCVPEGGGGHVWLNKIRSDFIKGSKFKNK